MTSPLDRSLSEAATDPAVLAAAADYERRVAENRPYEDAEDIEVLAAEYLRLYG